MAMGAFVLYSAIDSRHKGASSVVKEALMNERLLGPIDAAECLFRRGLPLDLPLDCHLHPQFPVSASDGGGAVPELPGICAAAGGPGEHLHCK